MYVPWPSASLICPAAEPKTPPATSIVGNPPGLSSTLMWVALPRVPPTESAQNQPLGYLRGAIKLEGTVMACSEAWLQAVTGQTRHDFKASAEPHALRQAWCGQKVFRDPGGSTQPSWCLAGTTQTCRYHSDMALSLLTTISGPWCPEVKGPHIYTHSHPGGQQAKVEVSGSQSTRAIQGEERWLT